MLKNILIKATSKLEQKIDDLAIELKIRLGTNQPLQIITYRTYGTGSRLYVKGRVLENKNIVQLGKDHTTFQNVLNMYKRFETDEVRDAELKITYNEKEYAVVAKNRQPEFIAYPKLYKVLVQSSRLCLFHISPSR